jgi:hypothetical protein
MIRHTGVSVRHKINSGGQNSIEIFQRAWHFLRISYVLRSKVGHVPGRVQRYLCFTRDLAPHACARLALSCLRSAIAPHPSPHMYTCTPTHHMYRADGDEEVLTYEDMKSIITHSVVMW